MGSVASPEGQECPVLPGASPVSLQSPSLHTTLFPGWVGLARETSFYWLCSPHHCSGRRESLGPIRPDALGLMELFQVQFL